MILIKKSAVRKMHALSTVRKKLCGRPPQYAPLPASWPLTFWPWKWRPSHMWRGLPVCQYLSS